MTYRSVITALGAGGFVSAIVLAFRDREAGAGVVIAASVLLLVLGLFTDRIQSITAKIAGNELVIPLHPVASVTRELREVVTDVDTPPETKSQQLEAIVSQLEQQIVDAIVEENEITPLPGVVIEDGQLVSFGTIDIGGRFRVRHPERVKHIRVTIANKDGVVFANASVPREYAEGGRMQCEITDRRLPLGVYEMITELVLDDGEAVVIDRQSFNP